MRRDRRFSAAAATALFFLTFPVFARSLHWSSFDVQARLEANGQLHVVERQTMVFDGDWNGGERIFRTRGRQSLQIHRVVRVEGTEEIPLQQGSLDVVDHWSYAEGNTIRWRSRLPTDPPFENKAITYLIDYTYSNVLEAGGSEKEFRLDHDFGMETREGVIERFTLRLELDPVWNSEPVTLTQNNVPPGQGAEVERVLTYSGAGDPPGFRRLPPAWIGLAVLALFAGAVTVMLRRFFAGERAVGRFIPLQSRFDESLLELPPEIAGAVWDAGIGAPEVAAILARMTQEKKLTTRTEGDTLHMHLRVDRGSLAGYERLLVDKLFFDGRAKTDTDAIRAHYKSSGFDPAAAIQHLLEEKLNALTEWTVRRRRFYWWVDAALLVTAGMLTLLAWLISDGLGAPLVLGGLMASFFFGLIAWITGGYLAKVVSSTGSAVIAPFILLGVACMPFITMCLSARPADIDSPVVITFALWCLALIQLTLDLMKSRDTPAKISFRRRIAAARQYFIEELAKPQPNLRDEWFPYVLAFGLGTQVERWFSAFGGASRGVSATGWSSSSSSSPSSSVSAPSWTGGGGAFGGAGASGTWAAAAGVMAAGVSAPSSSGSGSSGGGSSSSSSGGGGGGGW